MIVIVILIVTLIMIVSGVWSLESCDSDSDIDSNFDSDSDIDSNSDSDSDIDSNSDIDSDIDSNSDSVWSLGSTLISGNMRSSRGVFEACCRLF